MKFYNKITIALASLAVLASCTGQDDTFENKLFINAENFRNEVRTYALYLVRAGLTFRQQR